MHRSSLRRVAGGRQGLWASIITAAMVWLHASAASALSVHPLFFQGPAGFGFTAGAVGEMPIATEVGPTHRWLLAGARQFMTKPGLIVANHLSAVHENPQGQGRTPNDADPFIVDSTWTVSNQTGAALPGSLLVFTKIDTDGRYPGLRAGLDGDLLQIVEYSSAGTEYFFGGMWLPSLGVGQSVDLTVRYVVAGSLDYDAESNAFVLPRLGIAGLVVPEPMPLAGIVLGLLGMVGVRARRGRG
jgi:hypothetical protein